MAIGDRLRARARGDVPVAGLGAYARAGADAYELLDRLPPAGTARLCAWNAFVLQTYGDALAASGRTPGFVDGDAAALARRLYELVEGWLERARQAEADPACRLDVYLPQPLPHGDSASPGQVAGMRRALDAARARAAADVAAFAAGEAAGARLRSLLAGAASAADYAERLWTPAAGPDLRETLAATLRDALDRVYELGQLAARPDLLDGGGGADGRLRLPGEPGFDPWCLTDPLLRARHEADAESRAAVERLWQADPQPDRTLAIHAEIAAALDAGAVDYLPPGEVGRLAELAARCPWPGVLYARAPALVAGRELEPGERFVLVVGGEPGRFERAIVAEPPDARPELDGLDGDRLALAELLALFGGAGFRVYRPF